MKPYVYGRLRNPRAAVKVKRVDNRKQLYEVVQGEVFIVPAGTTMLVRPDAQVVDDKGQELEPTGRYLFTAETINPFHLVVDMFEQKGSDNMNKKGPSDNAVKIVGTICIAAVVIVAIALLAYLA